MTDQHQRPVRSEAGVDIARATLQILVEFESDIHTGRFMGVHDEVHPQLAELIDRGNDLEIGIYPEGEDDLKLWGNWLRDVAAILPYLWD